MTPKAQAYLFDTVVVTNHALFSPVLLWPLASASFAGGRFQALVLIMAKSGREKTPGVKKTISKDAQREERLKKSESKAEKLKSEKKKTEACRKESHKKDSGKSKKSPKHEEKRSSQKDVKKGGKTEEKSAKDKKKQKVTENTKEKTVEKKEAKKKQAKEIPEEKTKEKKTKETSKTYAAEKHGNAKDLKNTSPENEAQTRPSALKQEGSHEEPKRRRVSFKGAPTTVDYKDASKPSELALVAAPNHFRTPSPKRPLKSPSVAGSEISLDNVQAWKKEAARLGVSLETYMEDLSRNQLERTVEEHMKSLMKEKGENEKDENESESPEVEVDDIPLLSDTSSETSMGSPSESESANQSKDETIEAQGKSADDAEEEPEEASEEADLKGEEEEEDEEEEFEQDLEQQLDLVMQEKDEKEAAKEDDLVMQEKVGEEAAKEDEGNAKGNNKEGEKVVGKDALPMVIASQAAMQANKYGEFANANSTLTSKAFACTKYTKTKLRSTHEFPTFCQPQVTNYGLL